MNKQEIEGGLSREYKICERSVLRRKKLKAELAALEAKEFKAGDVVYGIHGKLGKVNAIIEGSPFIMSLTGVEACALCCPSEWTKLPCPLPTPTQLAEEGLEIVVFRVPRKGEKHIGEPSWSIRRELWPCDDGEVNAFIHSGKRLIVRDVEKDDAPWVELGLRRGKDGRRMVYEPLSRRYIVEGTEAWDAGCLGWKHEGSDAPRNDFIQWADDTGTHWGDYETAKFHCSEGCCPSTVPVVGVFWKKGA